MDEHSTSGYQYTLRTEAQLRMRRKLRRLLVDFVALVFFACCVLLISNHSDSPIAVTPVTRADRVVPLTQPLASVRVTFSPPWTESGWLACVHAYKAKFDPKRQKPGWYRYVNGECAENPSLPHGGGCYMMIHGPDRGIRDRKGYEVTLECMVGGSAMMICSTRKGYYTDEVVARMRTDPRCLGFPNLASDFLTLTPPLNPQPLKSDESAPKFGIASCRLVERDGFIHKIVLYDTDGRTYAINGIARSQAAERGWVDGFKIFSPEQMHALLRKGLDKCQQ